MSLRFAATCSEKKENMKKISDELLSAALVIFLAAAFSILVVFFGKREVLPELSFTKAELELLESSDSVMRVLTVKDSADLAVLRDSSISFTSADLHSEPFGKLCDLMLSTVRSPSQDGVGIAAPQVGLNRSLIAVQRFDKEGAPFELYPNVRIVSYSPDTVCGPEGCLSVPGERGIVRRSAEVVVSYTDPATLEERTDTVGGFTAVIFQHETDHLKGVIYTDLLEAPADIR